MLFFIFLKPNIFYTEKYPIIMFENQSSLSASSPLFGGQMNMTQWNSDIFPLCPSSDPQPSGVLQGANQEDPQEGLFGGLYGKL